MADQLLAESVSVNFEGVHALGEVSLAVEAGEILGLIGPNGAGKTTLVNVLSGFQRPDTGRVRLRDVDVTKWPVHRISRAGVARTFQGARLFSDMSVLENLEVAAVARGCGRTEARRRAWDLLDLFGLPARAGQRAGDLPFGEVRAIGIARAIMSNPHFLLMDEPAAGLSEAEAERLRETIRSIRQRLRCGILLIEHNMQLIMSVCDRVHVLEQGCTIASASPAEISCDTGVRRAYLGAASSVPTDRREPVMTGSVVLRVDTMTVAYGAVPALRDVSLQVALGEFVCVIGPNGAGKSTLMLTVAGLVQPERGSVHFDGVSMLHVPPERRVASGLALVPEGRRIFPALTVGENLRIGTTVRPADAGKAIDEVLQFFPVLRARFDAPAGQLSGGEQQQLAIARALLSRPRLLLLDEPSLGLAPQVIDHLYSILRQLHCSGLSILLVEQNAERALATADRAYVLRNGRVELEGAAAELRRHPGFDRAYFGFEQRVVA